MLKEGKITSWDNLPLGLFLKATFSFGILDSPTAGKATILCSECDGYFQKTIDTAKSNVVTCKHCKEKLRVC